MSNGLFIGDKDPVEIRVGSRKATSVFLGDKKVWSNVPDGANLHLSAKGLTTAGIAQSGGVVDLSGNGNNGTAYGGVAVVNDDEMGECFSYANSTSTQSIRGNFQNPSESLTLSVRYKRTGSIYGYNQLLLEDANSSNICRLAIYITTNTNVNLVSVLMYSNNDTDMLQCNINTTFGKVTTDEHVYTATYDASASLLSLYVDGILAATKIRTVQSFTVSKFIMGYPNVPYKPIGLINDIYIFPRALTAHEVKKLYMASRR